MPQILLCWDLTCVTRGPLPSDLIVPTTSRMAVEGRVAEDYAVLQIVRCWAACCAEAAAGVWPARAHKAVRVERGDGACQPLAGITSATHAEHQLGENIAKA